MCTKMLVARGVLRMAWLFRLFQKLRQSACCFIHHASVDSCIGSGTPRNSFSHTRAAQLTSVKSFSMLSSISASCSGYENMFCPMLFEPQELWARNHSGGRCLVDIHFHILVPLQRSL